MKFNIKSAMDYSSKLKNVIHEVERSLRVVTSLEGSSFSNNSINYVPAADDGMYKATITHKKSNLKSTVGRTFEDEEIKVEGSSDLAKLSPDTRLQLLNDLMIERVNIDYLIETTKNNSKITDEFSGKEVTYDLGCQINKMYREYNQNILRDIVEMDTELEKTTNGKVITVINADTADKPTAFEYPITIKATSNVNNKAVLNKYDEINDKCTLNSAKLSEVEISKFFEFEPKFNLNPSVRSLIEKYKEEK